MVTKILRGALLAQRLKALVRSRNWFELSALRQTFSPEISFFYQGEPVVLGKYEYSTVPQEQQDEVLSSFTQLVIEKDPLLIATKMTALQYRKVICQELFKKTDYKKLSVQVRYEGKIIAAFLSVSNQLFSRPKPQTEIQFSAWKKMELGSKFINRFTFINSQSCSPACYLVTGGVQEKFQGQGIFSTVLALKLAMAQQLGYNCFFAKAGFGERMSFKPFVKYLEFGCENHFSDFREGGEQVFGNTEGGLVLFLRDLRVQ